MKKLRLNRGLVALVDDADYARVSRCKWFVSLLPDGRVRCVQRNVRLDGKDRSITLGRDILGVTEHSITVKYRDGDPLNCQRSNLYTLDHKRVPASERKLPAGIPCDFAEFFKQYPEFIRNQAYRLLRGYGPVHMDALDDLEHELYAYFLTLPSTSVYRDAGYTQAIQVCDFTRADISNPEGWFLATIKTTCQWYFSRRFRQQGSDPLEQALPIADDTHEDGHESYHLSADSRELSYDPKLDLKVMIAELRARLTPELRALLNELEAGYTPRESSERLGISQACYAARLDALRTITRQLIPVY
jgi:DNA-directed RNA polymerase specialized sigma24 family protein